jgi:hypothetical protein
MFNEIYVIKIRLEMFNLSGTYIVKNNFYYFECLISLRIHLLSIQVLFKISWDCSYDSSE